MKRLLLLLVVIVAAAGGILFFVARNKSVASASEVANLLPADTICLVHVPDVERNREAWQRTELYQLYHEPAVQNFLRKPREQLPKGGGAVTEAWRDAASLRMHDVFLATNTVDTLRLIGGFEFRCEEKEARAAIDRWTEKWTTPGTTRSSNRYGKYTVEILSSSGWTMASVMVGHRFFAATSIDDLRTLLDRLDGRGKEANLAADENFRSAMRQIPADYAGVLYVQPKSFAQKLVALRAQSGRALPAGQQTLIERIQSFSHAVTFDGGKLRDIDFVAMPRLMEAKLTRDTLPLASVDTLLYLAAIVNLQQQLDTVVTAQDSTFSKAGVKLEDLKAAFGDEMSLLADWPTAARMPNVVATLVVRDVTRAKSVARALALSAGWQGSTRDDIDYFTAPASGLAMMRLIAAVSDKRLAIGLDNAGVERLISPPAEGSKLESTQGFRETSRLVPEGQQMFAWLDLPALYSRLDATLRPLLQISAAFMPEKSGRFDVSKLPPAEIITKHLSPVVASQSYVNGGYRSESVGTITLGQAAVLGMGGYAGWEIFQKRGGMPGILRAIPKPAPSPSAWP